MAAYSAPDRILAVAARPASLAVPCLVVTGKKTFQAVASGIDEEIG